MELLSNDYGRFFVTRIPELASDRLLHLMELREAVPNPRVSHRDPDGDLRVEQVLSPGDVVGWCIHLPYEKNPLPMNKKSHGSWRQTAAQVRMVRESAFTVTKRRIPPQDRIRVRLDWEVVDNIIRDEDNLAACMKALVDGIRIAGVVPNDNRTYVLRDFPEIHYAPKSTLRPRAYMRLWILKA